MSSKLQVKDKSESGKSIKIAPFKKEIRKTTPHKHNNYFEILYLSQGSGQHFIDSREFEVKPPVMYFIRREQVHYWQLDSEPEGYVIIVKKAFIEKCLDGELKTLFTKISRQSSVYTRNNSTIKAIFELLIEANNREGTYAFQMIEGLLKALLAKILEVAQPVENNTKISSDLYQSFLSLLGSDQVIRNSVQYYAKRLGISPQNLNIACRKAVDQSSEEVLSEFIINEAKRLLIYTDNTVAQISFALDFNDPSHFVKYFKRKTTQTPLAFRRSN